MPDNPYRQTAADRIARGELSADKLRVLDVRATDLVLDVPGSAKLDVKVAKDVNVATSVVGAKCSLTIDGASELTLDVEDPHGKLLRSDVLTSWAFGTAYLDEKAWVRRSKAVDVKLDGLVFRLVRVDKVGTRLTLTFEERAVTYLRRHSGARSASRANITRAQFAQMLVREVKAGGGIEWWMPERWAKQPIKRDADTRTAQERRDEGHAGLADGVILKGKDNVTLTESQLANAETALDVAESHNAGTRATLALIEACMIEAPNFSNPKGGDSSSVGVLQLLDTHLGGSVAKRRDVALVCGLFLTDGFTGSGGAIALAKAHPDWSPGQIAQACQGSAFPDRYDTVEDQARAMLRAYGGSSGETLGEYRKQFRFKREKDEDSWDALGRLAEEVRWRRFMRLGRLWFLSEDWLFRQKPDLRVVEGKDGVDAVDYSLDLFARGKSPVGEVTVAARASRWTALPGMIVLVDGQGAADGRWLVTTVERDLYDASGALTITLRKPLPKLAEPDAEKGVRPDDDAAGVDAVLAEAKAISKKGLPYVWGGGHVRAGQQDTGTPGLSVHDGTNDPNEKGFDCSGYTAACLLAGGMLPSGWEVGVPASGTFASSWGRPGTGQHMTVWANGEHVWIEFHDVRKRADTSPWGAGPSGPRLRTMNRTTAGFTPRHWPGT